MENSHDDFSNSLFQYLTKNRYLFYGALIKRHTNQLEKLGDYSFPLSINPWKQYITVNNTEKMETIFEFTYEKDSCETSEEACVRLVQASMKWPLKLQRCIVLNARIHMFLDRISTIRYCLENISMFLDLKRSSKEIVKITVQENLENDISSMRLNLFSGVFRTLSNLRGDPVADLHTNGDCTRHVHFTRKSADVDYKNAHNIFCAAVLNAKTGTKETELAPDDYLEKRKLDMQLIAQHKYGLRVKDENQWQIFLAQIGEAAVAFELLQIKHSHSVSISMTDNGSGCSKGAAFVLYNGARLTSILNTFKDNVVKGHYPPLPDLKDINLELLKDEDEWILVFNYLLAYPNILRKCLDFECKEGIFSPHLLCTFLTQMAGRISTYYRRIRILMEPRKHLIPLVHGRIHLLTALQTVLNHALSILNISPVTQM